MPSKATRKLARKRHTVQREQRYANQVQELSRPRHFPPKPIPAKPILLITAAVEGETP